MMRTCCWRSCARCALAATIAATSPRPRPRSSAWLSNADDPFSRTITPTDAGGVTAPDDEALTWPAPRGLTPASGFASEATKLPVGGFPDPLQLARSATAQIHHASGFPVCLNLLTPTFRMSQVLL